VRKTYALQWGVVALLVAGCATTAPPASSPTPTSAPTLSAGSGGTNRPDQLDKPYVVLMSFDGFRGDYLDHYKAPNFQRVAQQGVRAVGLIPSFPSKTFPNHYTIVTGDYPATHGIVANRFYDPARNAIYAIGDNKAVLDGSWYRGEPIWVTAEKQGMVAASYFWVGSEAAIEGIRPTLVKHFPDSTTDNQRADSALAWLALPAAQRPHFVAVYMSDVDNAGHRYGPDDSHVQDAITTVDVALGRMLDGISALPFRDKINVILVSDHGMASFTPETAVNIATLIDTVGVRFADGGPNANLHISGGAARARILRDSLNRRLQHGHAYLRDEVPARLHYRSDPRIGDVVVVMDEHWQIVTRIPQAAGGTHGWDPQYPSMHGIFLAMGPGIRAGSTIPPFENIQIYPLLTEILGLAPAAGIDGKAGWLRSQVMH